MLRICAIDRKKNESNLTVTFKSRKENGNCKKHKNIEDVNFNIFFSLNWYSCCAVYFYQ